MKTKFTLVLAVIAVITTGNLQQANAQSWSLAGNNNATTNSKLGTRNAVPLRLFTNNSARVFIRATSGNVGIGTTQPKATLEVNGNTILGKSTQASSVIINDIPSARYEIATGNFNLSFRQHNSTTGGFDDRLIISNGGNVGIGTTQPKATLEVNGNTILGKSTQASSVIINDIPSARYEIATGNFNLSFRQHNSTTNRFDDRLIIGNGGNVSIGTTPAAGFRLTIAGSGLASGGFWVNSDQKLKQNIGEVGPAMEIINQLKPTAYYFKTGEYAQLNLSTKKQYGFIAQDLEKVLPDLVNTSKQTVRMNVTGQPQLEDIKAVNYTALIPLLTKALQEQQKEIDELKQVVEKLSILVTNRTSAESTKSSKGIISGATLEQNTPNPMTHSTSIRYNLPLGVKKAQIIVADFTGNPIKQVTITSAGSGEINIDTSALKGGIYTYSLLVDGKVITSKKMVVAK